MKKTTALLCGLVLLLPASSIDARLRTWSVYTSDHFSVHTDARKKEARRLVSQLERFRELVIQITNVPRRQENQQLIVMLYSRQTDFRKIRPASNVGGYFLSTYRGPRMVIGPGRISTREHALFHEYVHYLLREHSSLSYARWYDEGLAELLSTIEIDDDGILIGTVPTGIGSVIRMFGPLSVSDLLEPHPEQNPLAFWERYYATAWLFTHFVQISPVSTDSALRRQTRAFNRRYDEGENIVDAFTAAYGISPAEMDTKLQKYRHSRRLTALHLKIAPYSGPIKQRELSDAERDFQLADTAARSGKVEVARKYVADIDHKADDPRAARALSLRALLLDEGEAAESADRLRDRALELDREDALVLSNVAAFDWQKYLKSGNEGSRDKSLLDGVLDYASQSTARDPHNIDAYKIQWSVFVARDDHVEAARRMMAAFHVDPANLALNFEIAVFLMAQDQPKLAAPFIERLTRWTEDPARRAEMDGWLERVVRDMEKAANNSDADESGS